MEPNFPSADLLTGETEELSELWWPRAGDGGANVRLNDRPGAVVREQQTGARRRRRQKVLFYYDNSNNNGSKKSVSLVVTVEKVGVQRFKYQNR